MSTPDRPVSSASPRVTSDATESLLVFPSRFAIKAVGLADSTFESLVVEILSRHVSAMETTEVSARLSREGKWLAVTLSFHAESRAQLDAIYRDLSGHERVVWVI